MSHFHTPHCIQQNQLVTFINFLGTMFSVLTESTKINTQKNYFSFAPHYIAYQQLMDMTLVLVLHFKGLNMSIFRQG